MRRLYNKSFDELVEENKRKLLGDPDAIKKIEGKIEKKHEDDFTKKN